MASIKFHHEQQIALMNREEDEVLKDLLSQQQRDRIVFMKQNDKDTTELNRLKLGGVEDSARIRFEDMTTAQYMDALTTTGRISFDN